MPSRVRFSQIAMGLRGRRSEISSKQMFNRYKFSNFLRLLRSSVFQF